MRHASSIRSRNCQKPARDYQGGVYGFDLGLFFWRDRQHLPNDWLGELWPYTRLVSTSPRHPLKLYPDHVPARTIRLVGDILASAWLTVWVAMGWMVYSTVMALEVIADGLSKTGRAFDSWLDAFKSASPRNIPYLSQFLQAQATSLQHQGGDQLIAAGNQANVTIQHLALALALVVALPPILIVVGGYLFWRWRDAREMGSALAFVRSAESSGQLEQAKALLAYRAIAALSFTELMKVTGDPIGDLAEHRYDALAALMLKKAGLESFRLYDRSRPALPSAEGSAMEQDLSADSIRKLDRS